IIKGLIIQAREQRGYLVVQSPEQLSTIIKFSNKLVTQGLKHHFHVKENNYSHHSNIEIPSSEELKSSIDLIEKWAITKNKKEIGANKVKLSQLISAIANRFKKGEIQEEECLQLAQKLKDLNQIIKSEFQHNHLELERFNIVLNMLNCNVP